MFVSKMPKIKSGMMGDDQVTAAIAPPSYIEDIEMYAEILDHRLCHRA